MFIISKLVTYVAILCSTLAEHAAKPMPSKFYWYPEVFMQNFAPYNFPLYSTPIIPNYPLPLAYTHACIPCVTV